MYVYHEIAPDSLESTLKKGLLRAPRGEKGDDSAIARTDHLLDTYRPNHIRHLGVSRTGNNYAYLCVDGSIIDITDGKSVPLPEFIKKSEGVVLEISVKAQHCYVSDLDAFDAVMNAVTSKFPEREILTLADTYWNTIVPLDVYKHGTIRRPEILLPYDVPPDHIRMSES